MLLEAETNKYCPGGYDIGAISNLITWVQNFFLSVGNMCAKYHFSNFQNTHGFIFPGLPGFNWQKFPIMKKFTPATPQILRLRGGNFAYPTLNTR